MKRKYFKLKDGTFYIFGEYTYEDIVGDSVCDYIRDNVGKDVLKQVYNFESAGRSYNKLAFLLGKKILRLFLEKIVDHLMESDRIDFGYDRYMYIGLIPNNPERRVRPSKQSNPLMHSGGRRYGIRMSGIGLRHYCRMPYRRRLELSERIKEGQAFYG